jgi:serine/threonine-protein kinase
MGLQLKHPNIVTIHDIQNDPRAPYLVMEFVEGETLREILKIRKQFGPIDGLNVVHDICSGLDFAFQKGITHRDLKLSNVLVHSSGKCKLVDFGLAAMADTSSDKAIADCPSARAIDYAALERGTGVRKGDTRSDIYFVGVMMYNVISGKQALVDTRERSQRLNVTRFHDFPSLSEVCRDLPEQIYTICNKALEFDPDKRYQTPNAMLADIQVALKSLENPNRVERRIGNRHDILAIDEEDAKEGEGKTVMVVENKQELQDVLREKLKKRGYKVLIFGDPERALSKFSPDESSPADCLVICAPDLGNLALDAFNRFAEQDHTKTIPAVMLVDPKQQHIIRGANTSPIHVLLPMPLKVRELRQALAKLTAR